MSLIVKKKSAIRKRNVDDVQNGIMWYSIDFQMFSEYG